MAYVYGDDAIPQVPLTGSPADALPTALGMLHDGEAYRAYEFSNVATNALAQ